jgi:hypothetical protein
MTPATPPGEFVSRFTLGDGVYADFFHRNGELVYTKSPALQNAQPPLQLFYAMELEKEYDRLRDELAATQ